MTSAVLQSELQCPNCAGQCLFSVSHQKLECQSCGNLQVLKTDQDHLAQIETPYHEAARIPPSRKETLTHQCDNCAGEIVFTGTSLSQHCPYCDGPIVLARAAPAYETMALIPFQVTWEVAQDNARYWLEQRRALPAGVLAQAEDARIAGLYAPFWTFDSKEAVEYWAKYTKGSGDNRRSVSISGSMKITFDDLLMPASDYVTPLIRDGILHAFDPHALRPYRAGYLAGFAAERHHQSVSEGIATNEADKQLLIRNRIKKHINKRGVHNIGFRTDTSGIHYRRILLPVWILHYRFRDKPYKIVVSAIDGRTYGERPFSMIKLALYSALLSAFLIAFGLFWGINGAL